MQSAALGSQCDSTVVSACFGRLFHCAFLGCPLFVLLLLAASRAILLDQTRKQTTGLDWLRSLFILHSALARVLWSELERCVVCMLLPDWTRCDVKSVDCTVCTSADPIRRQLVRNTCRHQRVTHLYVNLSVEKNRVCCPGLKFPILKAKTVEETISMPGNQTNRRGIIPFNYCSEIPEYTEGTCSISRRFVIWLYEEISPATSIFRFW